MEGGIKGGNEAVGKKGNVKINVNEEVARERRG